MPAPDEVQEASRERHQGTYVLGGVALWGAYAWALLAIAPAEAGLLPTALLVVSAFFLSALTVDYPIRLLAGRELGYVGRPWEFGRREHVEREWVASIDTCYRCGERDVPGVAAHAVVDRVAWGLPDRRIESGTNYDCRACARWLGHLPDESEPDWTGDEGSADDGRSTAGGGSPGGGTGVDG